MAAVVFCTKTIVKCSFACDLTPFLMISTGIAFEKYIILPGAISFTKCVNYVS